MRTYKLFGIIAGVCYICWWWAFLFFLPLDKLFSDYSLLILTPAWIPINILQVIGIISFMMFFIDYAKFSYGDSVFPKSMMLFEAIGFFFFCGIAFYETFLWPIIANSAPTILNILSGPIYSNLLLIISTGTAILLFLVGNIYLGIRLHLRYSVLSIIFMIGISLFCMGYMVGSIKYIIQSIGLTLFSIGMILIGFRVEKHAYA